MKQALVLLFVFCSMYGQKKLGANQIVLFLKNKSVLPQMDNLLQQLGKLKFNLIQAEDQDRLDAMLLAQLIKERLDTGIDFNKFEYTCNYDNVSLSMQFPYTTVASALVNRYFDREMQVYINDCKTELIKKEE